MLLDTKNTLFICIDIQERLLPLMAHKDEVIKNANLLLQVAEILGAQSLVSEQYPKGLGKTCEQIKIPQNEEFFYLIRNNLIAFNIAMTATPTSPNTANHILAIPSADKIRIKTLTVIAKIMFSLTIAIVL